MRIRWRSFKRCTDGLGADVAIEAVGHADEVRAWPPGLVRPGGHVANIGVHGQPATLHLESLWTRDVTITTGLVDTYSTPTLSRLVATRQLNAARFATHHFTLRRIHQGLRVCSPTQSETGALKIILAHTDVAYEPPRLPGPEPDARRCEVHARELGP